MVSIASIVRSSRPSGSVRYELYCATPAATLGSATCMIAARAPPISTNHLLFSCHDSVWRSCIAPDAGRCMCCSPRRPPAHGSACGPAAQEIRTSYIVGHHLPVTR